MRNITLATDPIPPATIVSTSGSRTVALIDESAYKVATGTAKIAAPTGMPSRYILMAVAMPDLLAYASSLSSWRLAEVAAPASSVDRASSGDRDGTCAAASSALSRKTATEYNA